MLTWMLNNSRKLHRIAIWETMLMFLNNWLHIWKMYIWIDGQMPKVKNMFHFLSFVNKSNYKRKPFIHFSAVALLHFMCMATLLILLHELVSFAIKNCNWKLLQLYESPGKNIASRHLPVFSLLPFCSLCSLFSCAVLYFSNNFLSSAVNSSCSWPGKAAKKNKNSEKSLHKKCFMFCYCNFGQAAYEPDSHTHTPRWDC